METKNQDLQTIRFKYGTKMVSVQEYINAAPQRYRRALTSGAYEVLRRGLPLNNGEIERLVRNDDNLQKLID